MKTALFFLEEDTLKIAYGQTLKLIAFKDLKLSHNVKFFEQLFQQANVVIVDKVVPFSKEELEVWAADMQIEIAPKKAEKEPVKTKEISATKATAEIIKDAQDDSNRILFRSTDETTIVIDDLQTTEDIPGAPGVKQSVAVYPERAVDLSQIPMEHLKKSLCLKKLIREGKLVPCTPAEAAELETLYQQKQKLTAGIGGLPKILDKTVEDFIGKGKTNTSTHDAETIDVENSEDETPSVEEEVETVEENRPPKQLAQRPRPANINMQPSSIKRKERT